MNQDDNLLQLLEDSLRVVKLEKLLRLQRVELDVLRDEVTKLRAEIAKANYFDPCEAQPAYFKRRT